MAEFVQQNLESMLPELEQLQRTQIFSKEEVKVILKKRKRFEYSIQKQEKRKEDFLAYIQYETSLLSLIELRREKLCYFHKKNEIDYSVVRRINKLYSILEKRFPEDTKIWMSHIEMLKRMKWTDTISKIYRAMLKTKIYEEDLWIVAAKYEFEDAGSPESARAIFLEALRFNKDSKLLYKEYFRFELLNAERLRKRSEVLGVTEIAEETKDDVFEGKIAIEVFKAAVKKVEDLDFVFAILAICYEFEFARKSVIPYIRGYLEETFPDSPYTWDGLARGLLYSDSKSHVSTRERLQECLDTYRKGLQKCADDETLLELMIQNFIEAASIIPEECLAWWTSELGKTLVKGNEDEILKEEHSQLLETFAA